ncbi:TonB-dependent receptor [Halioxenophilus aromaticivorans]|uniref:TonB-dependent receptor n=1 Tax=Halioxenophilus aromaticivorans TaxID=1306992 RepID=A0AAV3U955_9ALTE
MQKSAFNKKPLATCVTLAFLSGTGLAFAQESDQDAAMMLEEVVVTGVRGSLTRAMDIKRDSSGVVDAISAEDMGKFPDTNLAESLQRITGVSINRVNGEGSEVTVRGFGGGFNLVTLNGRQMPAANVTTITGNSDDAASQGTSRSFDFSSLASEGVAGLQVYKTGKASVPTGGVGATINVQTIKPLEAGNKGSIGIKGVMDESGEDCVTPELSGLYSWANDEGTFGVSVFGSYQERSSGSRGVNVSGYSFFDYSDDLSFLQGAEVVNAPEEGQLMALPYNVGVNNADINRERTNGMLTLQFAPSDKLTLTADALYTTNTLESKNLVPGIWFSRAFSFVEFDGSDVVATPLRLVEQIAEPDGRGKDLFYASWDDATKDELQSFGFNAEFHASDSLVLRFDAATSTAKAGGDGKNGANSWRANVAAAGAGWQAADYSGSVPQVSVGVVENTGPAGGNGNGVLDAADIATQTLRSIYSEQETDINQFQFDGTWDEGEGVRVDFGIGYVESEMQQTHSETQDFLGGWGVGYRDIPDPSLLNQENVTSEFDDFSLNGYPGAADIIPDGYYLTVLGREAFRVDPYAFGQALDSSFDSYDFNNLNQAAFNDNTVEEEIFSMYVGATFDGEIAGMTTQTSVGVRYEKTDVKSSARQNTVQQYAWTSDNDFVPAFSVGLNTIGQSYSYDNILPNIDFSVDISEQWKARASISQTLARPAYDRMFMTTSLTAPATLTSLGGTPTASRGTAQLDPLESTNFDLSVEYYYNDSSYASIGYYRKTVNNFVGTETVEEELFDLQDPTSGAAGTLSGAAQDALIAGGYTVNEQNMFTMAAILDNPADFPGGAADYVDPSQPGGAQQALDIIGLYDILPGATDPNFLFSVSQPVNTETAIIDGFELAWQHFFGESGFGFQANATLVDGDVGYNLAAAPTVNQFALEGLSDSANAVLIYEKGGWSARIAYNWRDAFLASTTYAGLAGLPNFVDEYDQIDFNVSYSFNDNFTVALDGINITGEGQTLYSRTKRMQWWNAEADPRYVLSARYSF